MKVIRQRLIDRFKKLMEDNKGGIVDYPLPYVPEDGLKASLDKLRKLSNNVVTEEELYHGAELSKGKLGGQNGEVALREYPDNVQCNTC
jgi:hypothetical protein